MEFIGAAQIVNSIYRGSRITLDLRESEKFKSYNLQQQTRRKVIDRVDITLATQSLCTLYMKPKFEQIACTFCSKLVSEKSLSICGSPWITSYGIAHRHI